MRVTFCLFSFPCLVLLISDLEFAFHIALCVRLSDRGQIKSTKGPEKDVRVPKKHLRFATRSLQDVSGPHRGREKDSALFCRAEEKLEVEKTCRGPRGLEKTFWGRKKEQLESWKRAAAAPSW